MEEIILISYLNDFIFCPVSIYFHKLYGAMDKTVYQSTFQINGINAHIQNDKLRTKFSKYLKKFGYRLQYSVYEITNSKRMLSNIMAEITNRFEKLFGETDSVIVIETSETCKITKWGYERNDDSDIIMVD